MQKQDSGGDQICASRKKSEDQLSSGSAPQQTNTAYAEQKGASVTSKEDNKETWKHFSGGDNGWTVDPTILSGVCGLVAEFKM